MSCTVTVNDPWPILDAASVAEQLTVVVRMANVEPDAGTQTTDAVTSPSVSSFAVTVKVTTAPSRVVASAVMFAGTVTTGGVPSAASATPIAPIWTITIAATVTMPTRATRAGVETRRAAERTEEEVPCLPTVGAPLWAELARTPDPTLHHPSPTVRRAE